MAVHHLNCGTLHPKSERLLSGGGSWTRDARMVCHCLLVETSDGLVLVDTGFGRQDIADPTVRLGWLFTRVIRPALDREETAIRQVDRLGYCRDDVRHVVLTHLDVDHAGGLADFPDATVHVLQAEHEAAMRPQRIDHRYRYRQPQWAHGPKWQLHAPDGERFEGFDHVSAVVEPEVLIVPLAGHSPGHAAVAVQDGDRWLLHCGDAYFDGRQLDPDSPSCPAGLALFERLVAYDNPVLRASQAQLRRACGRSDTLRPFCAHDEVELAVLSQAREDGYVSAD